jgi:hypothetical protein
LGAFIVAALSVSGEHKACMRPAVWTGISG